MSTTQEEAKSARRLKIGFSILEVTYAAWLVYYFSDTSANATVQMWFRRGPGRDNWKRLSEAERAKYDYNEERDFAWVNPIRIVILDVIMIVTLVAIGLYVFATNRFNKAVEMSESNPQEALKNGQCYNKIEIGMIVFYVVTLLFIPAALLRLACVATAGRFMTKLVNEIENRIVPEMNSTFGEGRDNVINTYPQSGTDSSIFPGSSSDSSQMQTV